MIIQTRYREKRIELRELIEEVYDMPRLGLDRLQGKRPEAQLLPLDSNKLRQVANVVVHLQGMLKDLEGNVKIIAEERRILRKLLIEYIEGKG
jgi:hypothetical protein